MKRAIRLAGVLIVSLASVATADEGPVRLLFAGSSSTYWNDLPDEVSALVDGRVAGAKGRPVTAEIAGRSGDDIRVYLEEGFDRYEYGVKPGQTFAQKIRDESFDYVALMVVCRFIMREDDGRRSHADAVSHYCGLIREAGGEPVFYEMGWGEGEAEEEGRRRILDLAVRNRVSVYAPCSTAWARVRAERPELDLQHPNDRVHPGDVGHFLNLACFHAAFTEESPVGVLPRTFRVWPHLTKVEKETRKAELDAALAAFKPTPYQAALPEWMRRHAAAEATATLDDETARYLETVAWETWQTVNAKLRAAPR